MSNLNDELLILLGWKCDEDEFWTAPDGNLDPLPRPYDNLQDAVELVPEGWAPESIGWSRQAHPNVKNEDDPGFKNYATLWNGKDGEKYRFAEGIGDTPAEALAEAIRKAVSDEKL